MKDIIRKSVLASLGIIDLSREKLQEAIEHLVERGKLTQEQGKTVFNELLERGKKEKETLVKEVGDAVKSAVDKIPIATTAALEKLEARLAKVEKKLKNLK